jgi:hypothetical protein
VTHWHLLRRLLRFHRRAVAALAGTAAVLSCAYALAGLVRSSAADAIADSVQAQNAGRAYAVQVNDPAALKVLTGRKDLTAIREYDGIAAGSVRELPATVRVIGSSAHVPGHLVQGRRPTAAGEALVSERLATIVGATLGDTLKLREAVDRKTDTVRIVGVTVDPADYRDVTVVIVDPGLEAATATLWLTDTDPFADAQLGLLADARSISGRTTDILAEDTSEQAATTLLAILRYAPAGVAALTVCVLLALLAALGQTVRRGIDGLIAAGMDRAAAWRLAVDAALASIAGGAIAGSLLALLAGRLFMGQLSHPIGQHWQRVSLPWVAVAAFIVGLTLGLAVAARIAVAVGARFSLPPLRLHWLVIVCLVTIACIGLGLALEQVISMQTAILSCLLIAFTLPSLLSRLAAIGTRTATKRVIATVAAPLVGLSLVAALITYATSYYAAWTSHNAISAEVSSIAPQPPGSLLVDKVSGDAERRLVDQYRQAGGEQVAAYVQPVESQHTLRVTSERVVQCMKTAGTLDPDAIADDCYPIHTSSPVNVIAMTDPPRAEPGIPLRADPGLVENGRVGLIDSDLATGKVISLSIVPAVAEPGLGGLLPGAVAPRASQFTKDHGLRESGTKLLAFLDFDKLPEATKADFRGTVTRVVPASMTWEDIDTTSDRERAIALGVALAGTGLIVLLLTTAGLTFISSQRGFRLLVIDAGGQAGWRRALSIRLFAIPAGCIVFGAGLARLAAWYTGIHDGSGFGWIWTLPAILGVILCVALVVVYNRRPGVRQ